MPCSTRPSATLYLALVLAAAWQGQAVNDWSVPCIGGECSWDLPADSSSSGSIYIVRLSFCQRPSLFLTFADRHTYTHSGDLPTPFLISPRPLAGKLRVATRLPRRKTFGSFARMTTSTVAMSSKGAPRTPSFVCQKVYVAFAPGKFDPLIGSLTQCGSGPFARVARHGFILPSSDNGVQTHVMSLDANFSAIRPSQYVLSHRKLVNFTPPTSFLCNKYGRIHFSLWGANMRGANYMTSSAWKRHWRTMSHDGPHANIDRRNVLDNELNGPWGLATLTYPSLVRWATR